MEYRNIVNYQFRLRSSVEASTSNVNEIRYTHRKIWTEAVDFPMASTQTSTYISLNYK